MNMHQFAITLVALLLAFGVAAKHHRQVITEVVYISDDYGNVAVDAGAEALAELALSRGDTFTVGFGEKEFPIYFGETFSDVPRGDWVAFLTPAGNLLIARNYENAADTLGVSVGDKVTLFN
ncbi:MAG: SAM hydroxide adenosyltransferase [Pseudomonadota bacterium]